MAATTITRNTITDGVGGTTLNAAFFGTHVFDEVDNLLSNDLTLGGLLAVEGQGASSIQADFNGQQQLVVRNLNSGTLATAQLKLGNDADDDSGQIAAFSSGFTELNATQQQDGVRVLARRAGGLTLAASDSAGDVRLFGRGTTNLLTFDGETCEVTGSNNAGDHAYSGVLNDMVNMTQTGTSSASTWEALRDVNIPANTLNTNGFLIRYHVMGTSANNTNWKNLDWVVGSTQLMTHGQFTTAAIDWRATLTLGRDASNSQYAYAEIMLDGTVAQTVLNLTLAETDSSTIRIRLRGQAQNSAANEVSAEWSYMEFLP